MVPSEQVITVVVGTVGLPPCQLRPLVTVAHWAFVPAKLMVARTPSKAKQYSPRLDKVDGRFTVVRAEQLRKALLRRTVTPSGIVIEVRLRQEAKALTEISVTVAGIVKLEQPGRAK